MQIFVSIARFGHTRNVSQTGALVSNINLRCTGVRIMHHQGVNPVQISDWWSGRDVASSCVLTLPRSQFMH